MNKVKLLISILTGLFLCSCNNTNFQNIDENPSINIENGLVVTFSCTGNTLSIANKIVNFTNSEHFIINPKTPYNSEDLNYSNSTSRASIEQKDESARPEIDNSINDFDKFKNVFIGYPLWFGIAPRIIQTFIESYDFSLKNIYIFSTSSSSSGQSAYSNLKNLYQDINFVSNIHFTSSNLSKSDLLIENWLKEISNVRNNFMINIKINDINVSAEIFDNSVGRDLINRLPLTLNFTDYNNTEKIAYLPSNSKEWDLSDCPTSTTPKEGDITMYAPWGNIAIFYNDFRESSGLVPIGRLDQDGIKLFKELKDNFVANITKI